MPDPIKVLVTGAASQVAYFLLIRLAKGDVFGKDQPIILVLFDIEPLMSILKGVVNELYDCALPLVEEIISTPKFEVGFKDIDVAILAYSMRLREGMERKDLLAANVKIFQTQGKALNNHAKGTTKVVVVSNPANTNALICMKHAPNIPPENFSALTRLDQNRAQYQIAARCGVSSQEVKNVIIWGNHSSTLFADVTHATVDLLTGRNMVREAIADDVYLKEEFLKTVQQLAADVTEARNMSNVMSTAKAISDHVHDWWNGVPAGSFVSMAVCSDGSYGIEKGLIYSFPVVTKADHSYQIVQGLSIDYFARSKMNLTMEELKEERDMVLWLCAGFPSPQQNFGL